MEDDRLVQVKHKDLRALERKVADLATLIEVSAFISSSLDYAHVMSVVMEKAKQIMDAEACSILMYNKETDELEFDVALGGEDGSSDILKRHIRLKMGEGIAGWVAEKKEPILVRDAKTDTRFFSKADAKTGFVTKSMVAVPLLGRSGLIGVAEIMNPRSKDFFDDYDLEIFHALCRQVATAIENALFHQESLERQKQRQELELAATLQRSFLPDSPEFSRGAISISAVNISAKHVGGDLYDFIEPVEGKVGIIIGDVSGKGVSAALFMAKMISDFRYNALRETLPHKALGRLNDIISTAPRGIFLTATYVIADTVSGELLVSSAGHPPLIWITGGEVRMPDVKAGPPLGVLPFEYETVSLSPAKGDRIIMFTDGVFDAKNKSGERIGFDEIIRCISSHSGPGRLLPNICSHVNEFSQGADLADDMTIVEISIG